MQNKKTIIKLVVELDPKYPDIDNAARMLRKGLEWINPAARPRVIELRTMTLTEQIDILESSDESNT
jgi:hypothetical protein